MYIVMKKVRGILSRVGLGLLVAAVAAAGVVNGNREPSDLWVLCVSGASGAAEDFREYIRNV